MEEALKELRIAEHLLAITSQLVSDPKINASIFEHLYKALVMAAREFIEVERRNRGIGFIPQDEDLAVGFFIENYAGEVGEGVKETLREMLRIRAIQREGTTLGDATKTILISKDFELSILERKKLEELDKVVKDVINWIGEKVGKGGTT
ncbi:MAG: hypothetical protein QW507_00645 [Candidatus Nanoarchaeia archaeon]|nr:hypothetical protein [Candidatus Haiyanarchaeum thermophilum]MCW1302910.1 hypothetical protein [Candidatus Haiyanarchaeum thermophilum]MCW1303589.1 hypothetical protein [Candidatus Haiyanarchaeum thermophilum]MCW1306271.1 hypothetical protein [Candidatus Haiyanarchaeum thermophilum]MCW1307493.1 hypothetical protein [Candidatus Haiyanarchaeum thermophilum]